MSVLICKYLSFNSFLMKNIKYLFNLNSNKKDNIKRKGTQDQVKPIKKKGNRGEEDNNNAKSNRNAGLSYIKIKLKIEFPGGAFHKSTWTNWEGGSYGQLEGGGVRILLSVWEGKGGADKWWLIDQPDMAGDSFGGCLMIHPVKFLAID